MMDSMLTFSVGMLNAVADFLGSEPIIYVFGLVCLLILIKGFKNITSF